MFFCRNSKHLQRTNKCDLKIEICYGKDRKHFRKRRKCWLPAFSSFPTMFSEGYYLRVVKSRDCVVKEITPFSTFFSVILAFSVISFNSTLYTIFLFKLPPNFLTSIIIIVLTKVSGEKGMDRVALTTLHPGKRNLPSRKGASGSLFAKFTDLTHTQVFGSQSWTS